jgi:hypothetical protein
MTLQEQYIRTLSWRKYEDLTQEEIDCICDTTAYHVFALQQATNRFMDLIIEPVFLLATWIESGIRRCLRN